MLQFDTPAAMLGKPPQYAALTVSFGGTSSRIGDNVTTAAAAAAASEVLLAEDAVNMSTMTLVVTTLHQWFVLFMTLLQLLVSIATCAVLIYVLQYSYSTACKVADEHWAEALQRHKAEQQQRVGGRGGSSSIGLEAEDTSLPPLRLSAIHFLLPEQFTAAAMLLFLLLWQGAVPALCILLDSFGVNIPDGWQFASGLISSLSQTGLLFCFIVYVDGLKYHSASDGADEYYDELPPPPMSQGYLAALRGGGNAGGGSLQKPMYDPFALPGTEAHSGYAPIRDTDAEYWRRDSSYGHQQQPSRNKALYYSGRGGNSIGYQLASSSSLSPQDDALLLHSDKTLALYVTSHHPCSREFLGFIYRKVLFLLLTWAVLVSYWLLMFPQMRRRRGLVPGQLLEDLQFRFAVAQAVIFALELVWCCWLVQTFATTQARLKRAKLLKSRFRQLAFHTLKFQVN